MLVKILGVVDLLAAILIFLISWSVSLPSTLVWVFIIILLLKGLFILGGDIASGFDLITGVILILCLYFTIPRVILLILGFFIFQKGFLSVLA